MHQHDRPDFAPAPAEDRGFAFGYFAVKDSKHVTARVAACMALVSDFLFVVREFIQD